MVITREGWVQLLHNDGGGGGGGGLFQMVPISCNTIDLASYNIATYLKVCSISTLRRWRGNENNMYCYAEADGEEEYN